MNHMEDWMKITEVAEFTGIKFDTLHRWWKKKMIRTRATTRNDRLVRLVRMSDVIATAKISTIAGGKPLKMTAEFRAILVESEKKEGLNYLAHHEIK